jgi:hypothetical protein
MIPTAKDLMITYFQNDEPILDDIWLMYCDLLSEEVDRRKDDEDNT